MLQPFQSWTEHPPAFKIYLISTASCLVVWYLNPFARLTLSFVASKLRQVVASPRETNMISPDKVDTYLEDHYLNSKSLLYSYLLWATFLLTFLSAIAIKSDHLRIRLMIPPLQICRQWFLKRGSRRVPVSSGSNTRVSSIWPSNGNIASLAFLFLTICCFSFAGPDYLLSNNERIWVSQQDNPPSTRGAPINKSIWTSAARLGSIAFASFPLCILFGLKGSPFAIFTWKLTTQLFFDKLSFLHRWIARIIWVITLVHVVLWGVQLTLDRESATERRMMVIALQKDRFICGWVAFVLFTLLILASSKRMRTSHYEVFYAIHTLLFPCMLLLCFFHHPETGWWVIVSLSLWLGERAWRLGWFLWLNGLVGRRSSAFPRPSKSRDPWKTPRSLFTHGMSSSKDAQVSTVPYHPPPGYAHAELLAGATVRLTFTTTLRVTWLPGQHFMIMIPSVSAFKTHPFTCATIFHDAVARQGEHTLVFLVRARNGWTKQLWDMVARATRSGLNYPPNEELPQGTPLPTFGVIARMYVDGPYGSSARVDWGRYSSILIVVGGSGVTYGLSVLEHLSALLASKRVDLAIRRVRFIWLVRDFSHMQWCASSIRRCRLLLPDDSLQLNIFVTKTSVPRGPTTALPSQPLDLEEVKSPSGRSEFLPSSQAASPMAENELDLTSPVHDSPLHSSDPDGFEESFLDADLTNFEGDNDFVIPGEIPLSNKLKREGRVRRAKSGARRSSGRPFQDSRRGSAISISSTQDWLEFQSDMDEGDFSNARPSSISRFIEGASSPLSPLSIVEGVTGKSVLGIAEEARKERRHSSLPPAGSKDLWLPLHCAPPQTQRDDVVKSPVRIPTNNKVQLRLDKKDLADMSVVAEYARSGKPRISKIIRYELEEAERSLMVTCCGPVSLNALTREAVALSMKDSSYMSSGKYLNFYSEDFEY